MLDEETLENARRVLGARTYSAAVNAALEEVLRIRKIQNLSKFSGTGLWQADLTGMRKDRPRESRETRVRRRMARD